MKKPIDKLVSHVMMCKKCNCPLSTIGENCEEGKYLHESWRKHSANKPFLMLDDKVKLSKAFIATRNKFYNFFFSPKVFNKHISKEKQEKYEKVRRAFSRKTTF